jgi:hypothetical protein
MQVDVLAGAVLCPVAAAAAAVWALRGGVAMACPSVGLLGGQLAGLAVWAASTAKLTSTQLHTMARANPPSVGSVPEACEGVLSRAAAAVVH